MFVLNVLVFVICVVLTVVVFRFNGKRNKNFSIISKILSVLLLLGLIVNLFFGPITWQADLFLNLATIAAFLLMILIELILEFPLWENWSENW